MQGQVPWISRNEILLLMAVIPLVAEAGKACIAGGHTIPRHGFRLIPTHTWALGYFLLAIPLDLGGRHVFRIVLRCLDFAPKLRLQGYFPSFHDGDG